MINILGYYVPLAVHWMQCLVQRRRWKLRIGHTKFRSSDNSISPFSHSISYRSCWFPIENHQVEEQRYLFINDVVKRMANVVYSEGARTLILSVSAGAISSMQLNHFYLLFFCNRFWNNGKYDKRKNQGSLILMICYSLASIKNHTLFALNGKCLYSV